MNPIKTIKKDKYLFLLFPLVFFSCKDFIEPSLTDKNVTLIYPANNSHTSANVIAFNWKELEGALSYNLQIASPSFSNMQLFLLDTTVSATQFNYTLLPGTYQWKVRALNGSSASTYSTNTLIVDSTGTLSNQTLVLKSPNNALKTNSPSIVFKWHTISTAEEYRLQIIDQQTNLTLTDINLLVDSFSYSLNEGTYTWKVRAQNSFSNTLYTSRTITIDTTAPLVSQQLTPVNSATVTLVDTLNWSRNTSAMGDSVFIYSDSLVSTPIVALYTTNTQYIFSGILGQTYFWRLKTNDEAGNWSNYSSVRKYKVQ